MILKTENVRFLPKKFGGERTFLYYENLLKFTLDLGIL